MEITIGSRVTLNYDGIPGFGSLNGIMLSENGYKGQELTITEKWYSTERHQYWIVYLPSGYKLAIHKHDIRTIHPPL